MKKAIIIISLFAAVALASPWDMVGAMYSGKIKSVKAQDDALYGVTFNRSGTRMWTVGPTNDTVMQWNLSTAFDVTTAAWSSKDGCLVNGKETSPVTVFFSSDEKHFYVTGNVGRSVNQYGLSVAGDVSTCVFEGSASLSGYDTAPYSLWFNNSGTMMYFAGNTNKKIFEFALTTAWNISTLAYRGSSSAFPFSPYGIAVSEDGKKILVSDGSYVYNYMTLNPWNTTGSNLMYTGKNLYVNAQSSAIGVYVNSTGTGMYTAGNSNDSVVQYNFTAQAASTCTPTASQNWFIDCEDDCVVSGQVYDVKNISFWGAGRIDFQHTNVSYDFREYAENCIVTTTEDSVFEGRMRPT